MFSGKTGEFKLSNLIGTVKGLSHTQTNTQQKQINGMSQHILFYIPDSAQSSQGGSKFAFSLFTEGSRLGERLGQLALLILLLVGEVGHACHASDVITFVAVTTAVVAAAATAFAPY